MLFSEQTSLETSGPMSPVCLLTCLLYFLEEMSLVATLGCICHLTPAKHNSDNESFFWTPFRTILSTSHAFVYNAGAGIISFLQMTEKTRSSYMTHPRSPIWSIITPDHTPRLGPSRDPALNCCMPLPPTELRVSSGGEKQQNTRRR